MRFINQEHAAVSLAQSGNLIEGRKVTVHTEKTVCHDKFFALALRLLQECLEMRNIAMSINRNGCPGKSAAVNQARVVFLICKNCVTPLDDRRNDPCVC